MLKETLKKIINIVLGRKNKKEIDEFLKDSQIEEEIKYYLDNNNITSRLRYNINFLSLVEDKIRLDNHIFNLKEVINEGFFSCCSPDEMEAFYDNTREEQEEQLNEYANRIDEYKKQLNNELDEMKKLDDKINSMLNLNLSA